MAFIGGMMANDGLSAGGLLASWMLTHHTAPSAILTAIPRNARYKNIRFNVRHAEMGERVSEINIKTSFFFLLFSLAGSIALSRRFDGWGFCDERGPHCGQPSHLGPISGNGSRSDIKPT